MDTPLMNSVCHMMMMWSPVKRKKLLLILCITIIHYCCRCNNSCWYFNTRLACLIMLVNRGIREGLLLELVS